MSFFNDPEITSFLSNKSTPQKTFSKKIFNDNTSKISNLFTHINSSKTTKNIFSPTHNKFSNFKFFSNPKNEVNYINKSDRIIFKSSDNNNNDNNQIQNAFKNDDSFYNCKYDSSIGIIFRGKQMKANNENIILMSITSLPEFSHGSYEELRMADLERRKTGNIIYFKIKNTSLNNINSGDNNNIFNKNIFKENSGKNNNTFKNNIFNENSVNNNNIFNKKLESNLFNFSYAINKKSETLFSSNNIDNNKTRIIFPKNNFNSPFSYIGNNNNNKNKENYNNNKENNIFKNNILLKNNIVYGNNTLNNNININNNLLNSLDNLDIFSMLSEKGNLSKEIIEAIQKEKTVKEFLEDLYKKYTNSENIYENNLCINQSQNNSVISDLHSSSFLSNNSNGISSLQKNNNNNYENDNFKNISDIDLRNSFNSFHEVQNFNMEIDNDINYDKLSSKLKNIYGIYERNNINCNNNKTLTNNGTDVSNDGDTKLNLNLSKTKIINDNEYYFNKTFTNGFHNNNSLLNNSLSNPNKGHTRNNSNTFFGRDESLYQQNLYDLNKLSISNINLKQINEKKTRMKDNNQIFSVNNNNNEEKMLNQKIDLKIEYHLLNEENKNKKDIIFYNIKLPNINRLIKVKELKEKIKIKVYDELKNKNIYNYKIQKITLLTPLEFLSDDNNLIDYKLNYFNYTIQAYISYEIIKIKQNQIEFKNNGLAPIELVPKLTKTGYECIPSIYELCRKTCEELKKIENFKIFNLFGKIEFQEPINLLGVDLDKEVTIEKNMINTGEKLNYWSIFKLYNFIIEENEIEKYIIKIKNLGGKFISYNNKVLIWEYRGENGLSN